jgi:hypothetical protein
MAFLPVCREYVSQRLLLKMLRNTSLTVPGGTQGAMMPRVSMDLDRRGPGLSFRPRPIIGTIARATSGK